MEKNLFELAGADVTPGFDMDVKDDIATKMFSTSIKGDKLAKQPRLPRDAADDIERIHTAERMLDNAVRILHRIERRDYVNTIGERANNSIMNAVSAIEKAHDSLHNVGLIIYTYATPYMFNDTPVGTAEEYDDIVVDSNADWEYNDTANNVKDTLSNLKGY